MKNLINFLKTQEQEKIIILFCNEENNLIEKCDCIDYDAKVIYNF